MLYFRLNVNHDPANWSVLFELIKSGFGLPYRCQFGIPLVCLSVRKGFKVDLLPVSSVARVPGSDCICSSRTSRRISTAPRDKPPARILRLALALNSAVRPD